MKTLRPILMLVMAFGLWLMPDQMAHAGACCDIKSKAAVAKSSGCADKCGCCCTTAKAPEAASSCCSSGSEKASQHGAACGTGCNNCTCMASAPAAPAPFIPVVPPPTKSIAPEFALPRAAHTFDFAELLQSPQARPHEYVCWTGPPVYLLNSTFRI